MIVTSRQPQAVAEADRRLAVAGFAPAESVRLLCRRCPWLTRQAAVRIATIVAGLPLSLAQAGALLAQTRMDSDEYLPRLVQHASAAPEDSAEGHVGLAATVAVGLECLAALDPAAVDLLDQLALLAAEPVPLRAATASSDPAPGLVVGDPQTTQEIVSGISGFGLATRDGTSVQLHPRVHALIGNSLAGPRRSLVLGRALRLLATAEPGDPADPAHWPFYAAITPHVHAALAHLPDAAAVAEPAGLPGLIDRFCRYLRLIGRPQDSLELAEAVHLRRQRTYGTDDPRTLRWVTNRGIALGSLDRQAAAREVLGYAHGRLCRVVGGDHPETMRAAAGLGLALAAAGEHEAAQRLLLDTLTRRRRMLGVDARETLQTAADLGAVLDSSGYHEQARRVLEEVAARRRRVLGPDHPDTLACGYRLGLAVAALGDHGAARPVLQDTLRRQRLVLGASDPDTLRTEGRGGELDSLP